MQAAGQPGNGIEIAPILVGLMAHGTRLIAEQAGADYFAGSANSEWRIASSD
jgi:hypothetical protein